MKVLERIEGLITMVAVPFDTFPPVYVTGSYGARVIRGDEFSVRFDSGEMIYPEVA